MFGDGSQMRDFVFVDVPRTPSSGRACDACDGGVTTSEASAHRAQDSSNASDAPGTGRVRCHGPEKKAIDAQQLLFGLLEFAAATGWTPLAGGLREGFRRTIDLPRQPAPYLEAA